MRTCVGCRRRDSQHLLVRVVRLSASSPRLQVDARRRLPGRGAWLHPEPQCLQRALSRRAFDRAFRAAVDATDVESWIAQHVPGHHPTRDDRQPESGSEH
ncbi:YlxR family protein [Tersicoccus sp. MR15.9]